MYVSNLESKRQQQGQPQEPLYRSLGEYAKQGYSAKQNPPQSYLVSHPLFPPSTQAAHSRNQ